LWRIDGKRRSTQGNEITKKFRKEIIMIQPPDFIWKCQNCGKEFSGSYSETGFEQPIIRCPDPNCDGFLEKVFEKKGEPFPENSFKKY
jgi:hypothetical protein